MAETPFSPESGAASGGTAPVDGNTGNADPSSSTDSPETAAADALVAATETAEIEAEIEPEAVSVEPVPVAEPAAPAQPPAVAAAAAEPSAPSVPEPPGVAATIAVPPLEEAASGGGEWELLVERFSSWWTSGELQRQWQRIRGPLKGVAILVAVLLALQVYATVVSTIDAIPLVSGLLELTGLIAVLQFSVTRLLRSSDRQQVVTQLQRRWLDFRGRS